MHLTYCISLWHPHIIYNIMIEENVSFFILRPGSAKISHFQVLYIIALQYK